jgi:hypothetical protein
MKTLIIWTPIPMAIIQISNNSEVELYYIFQKIHCQFIRFNEKYNLYYKQIFPYIIGFWRYLMYRQGYYILYSPTRDIFLTYIKQNLLTLTYNGYKSYINAYITGDLYVAGIDICTMIIKVYTYRNFLLHCYHYICDAKAILVDNLLQLRFDISAIALDHHHKLNFILLSKISAKIFSLLKYLENKKYKLDEISIFFDGFIKSANLNKKTKRRLYEIKKFIRVIKTTTEEGISKYEYKFVIDPIDFRNTVESNILQQVRIFKEYYDPNIANSAWMVIEIKTNNSQPTIKFTNLKATFKK